MRNNGFNLIEMSIIFVIIGLLAGVGCIIHDKIYGINQNSSMEGYRTEGRQ